MDPRFRLHSEEAPSSLELAQTLATEIERRRSRRLLSRTAEGSRKSNRASSLGDPCLRRLVYWRTRGEEAKPISEEVLCIFEEGNMLEGPIRREIESLGFEISEQQRSFPQNDFNVSGHIDGKIQHHLAPVRYILEIKTVNGSDWNKLRTIDDIREHKKSWVKKWASQGDLYAALSEICRWGDDAPVHGVMFALFDKWGGRLRIVPSPLDYSYAEALLDKALVIEDHVAKGTLPDFCEDRSECPPCPFHGITCHPPMRFEGEGLQVVDEPDVIAALDALDRHEEGWTSYEEAYKFLFDSKGGRLRGAEYVVVPHPDGGADWHVKGSFAKSVSYAVPEDVRAPYRKENPRGRYTPHIELVRRKEP